MASITKKRNKSGEIISYQIRVYRGNDINGNRLKPYLLTWKPPEGMTKKQMQNELNRVAYEFEEECKHGRVSTSNITLREFCKEYLVIMGKILAPTTYEFYRNNINQCVIPELGNQKLKEINTHMIQDYIQKLTEKPVKTRGKEQSGGSISPSTVKRYLTVLQSIFKLALKVGIINENPARAERLTLPKIVKPKIEIFSKQEAAAILEALEKEPIQFQVLIQLAIITGARRGELVGLKFSDFDYDNYKVTIQRSAIKLKGEPTSLKAPKDYESRTIAINPYCIELLEELKKEKNRQKQRKGSEWEGDEWLFTKANGEIMNPQTPTVQFTKFLKKNGFRHRKLHALRHTSATLLLYSGINIKQVQTRLGHSDIETTNKYLHYIEEADEAAAEALTNLLQSNKTTSIKGNEGKNDEREAKKIL